MQLIEYSIIVFIISFILQVIFIIIIEKRQRKKLEENNIEKVFKRDMIFIIKLLFAIAISVILAIITFYGLGIATIAGLREGH